MDGLQVFRAVLDHLSASNPHWLNALRDQAITAVPSGRMVEINGAILRWDDLGEKLFTSGFHSTGATFKLLEHAPCSVPQQTRVELQTATTVGLLYPYPHKWPTDSHVKEFVVANLAQLLPPDRITLDFVLEEALSRQPFLVVTSPAHTDHCVYHAATLGYLEQATPFPPWWDPGLPIPSVSLQLKNVQHPELVESYQRAIRTIDPFFQFVAFYHIVEFKFYEGLYQKLTVLRQRSVKEFIELIKRKTYPEESMFQFVFDELACGFTDVLDVNGILNLAPTLHTDLGCKQFSSTARSTWVEFLYKVRCGIVHAKEAEPTTERTPVNTQVLIDYVLPFMKSLCEHLIENV